MAVVDNVPLLIKCCFPPLYFLQIIRHFFYYRLIAHAGVEYHKTCRHILDPFFNQVRAVLDGKFKPTVLEFGAGPHPAFDAYPSGTHLICVDPFSDFNDLLNENWKESHLSGNGTLTVINSKIEELDSSLVEDGSVDLVLSRLANCSVSDVDATFKTVHRVLKKRGRYYFWDHIQSKKWLIRFAQWVISLPVFSYFTDCSATRRPFERLKAVGFTEVTVNCFQAPLKGLIENLYTATASGYAVK